MAEDCIFCKIVKGDIPAEKIEESENFIAIQDASPRVEGHTLVMPKKHFVTIMDMPADLASELIDVIKRVADKKLNEGAEGFNLVSNNFRAAGQEIEHVHFHLLPRKKGDGFKLLN